MGAKVTHIRRWKDCAALKTAFFTGGLGSLPYGGRGLFGKMARLAARWLLLQDLRVHVARSLREPADFPICFG
jgi:hypothetical protein